MRTCSHCAQEFPEDCCFCVHCGQKVETPACPQCQTPLVPDSQFCHSCGHDLRRAPLPAEPPAAEPEPFVAEPVAAEPAPVIPPVSPPPTRGSSTLVIFSVMLVLLGLGKACWPKGEGTSTPPVTVTPKTADLGPLPGVWSLDENDPNYDAGLPREERELVFEASGQEVTGKAPDQASLRFWAEGENIVGEARLPSGSVRKIRWDWVVPGEKARLSADRDGKEVAITLLKGPAPEPSPTVTVARVAALYEKEADLNGDGQPERACVESPDLDPRSKSAKVLAIYAADGSQLYRSQPFEEPFDTNLDKLAENAEQKAGLHILPAEPYPKIRLIFASASDNFADFQFDGHNYALAGN